MPAPSPTDTKALLSCPLPVSSPGKEFNGTVVIETDYLERCI